MPRENIKAIENEWMEKVAEESKPEAAKSPEKLLSAEDLQKDIERQKEAIRKEKEEQLKKVRSDISGMKTDQ